MAEVEGARLPMSREPLPQLSTQQLEYLVAVADADTWAEAAAALGVTPSALSQGLSQLERRIGVPLFNRDGRRRVPHPGAGPVLSYARRVVGDTRDLARWARAVSGGEPGQLRVGMIDLAAVAHFGPTLQRFRREHPDVDLHLAVAPSGPLSEQLLAGQMAVAVIVEPVLNRGQLALTPLLRDQLGLYAPEGAEAGSPASWGPWVTFPSNSHTRQLIGRKLSELGATFDVVAESHQPEVLRGMVVLGMGWTVLPVAQAETGPSPLRRAQPEPLMSRQLVVAQRHGANPDAMAQRLISRLIDRAGRS
jgi:DNA-binding transcriptional LysR family regulator